MDPTTQPAIDPAFLLPAKSIGRYQLLNVLGHGSMASVYLAHDPALDREVAIKTLNHAGGKHANLFESNFINEARAVARLNYPHIVTVYEAGKADGFAYIAMEYLSGQDLREVIWNETRFNYIQISDLILRIARALDHAHQHGVVHRDIKPANILLLKKNCPKILDFGLAQPPVTPGSKAELDAAHVSQLAGTPHYMSPEQVRGKPIDGRSDIFSLGVIMYELLTQHKPFSAPNITELLEQIQHYAPTLPSELQTNIPHELEVIVARALAKDPAKRYQRAYDLAKDLGRYSAKARAKRVLDQAQKSRLFLPNTLKDQSSSTRLSWFRPRGRWLTGWFNASTQAIR